MLRHSSADVATLDFLLLFYYVLAVCSFFVIFSQNTNLDEDSIILHAIELLSLKYSLKMDLKIDEFHTYQLSTQVKTGMNIWVDS